MKRKLALLLLTVLLLAVIGQPSACAEDPDEPGLEPGTTALGVAIGTPNVIDVRFAVALHNAFELNLRAGGMLGVGFDLNGESRVLLGYSGGLGAAWQKWFGQQDAFTLEGSVGINYSLFESCADSIPPQCDSRLSVMWDVLFGWTRQWDTVRLQVLGQVFMSKYIPRPSEFEHDDELLVGPGLNIRMLFSL